MFLIGSIIYILPAIVFMFFGSAQVQTWNDPEKMMANDNNTDSNAHALEKVGTDNPTVTRL